MKFGAGARAQQHPVDFVVQVFVLLINKCWLMINCHNSKIGDSMQLLSLAAFCQVNYKKNILWGNRE
jgi:hypothetical protein